MEGDLVAAQLSLQLRLKLGSSDDARRVIAKAADGDRQAVDELVRMLCHKIQTPDAEIDPDSLKTECPVCMEGVWVSVSLDCGHACCPGCWDHWKASCEKRGSQLTCPLCRNCVGPPPPPPDSDSDDFSVDY